MVAAPHAPRQGELDNKDFAKTAKEKFGIEAIEYVNQFWKDKAKDAAYVAELKKRAEDLGVKTLLIMCDGEGDLGDPDAAKRTTAVENHYKWVEAAKELGCHSIRVNAAVGRQPALRGAAKARRRRAAATLRVRRAARPERDRREPRRPVEQRAVAGRRDEAGR